MLVGRQDVLTYIPQREPIVVVHGLETMTETTAITVFHVEEGHLFVRNGKLLEAGIMENIAQSCALSSGYRFASNITDASEAATPPIGFIGGLKNFIISDLPSVGSVIHTTINVLHEVMGMQVVEASVQCGKHVIASCEIKIFLSGAEPMTETSN